MSDYQFCWNKRKKKIRLRFKQTSNDKMAYQPTDNSPRLFPEVHRHGEAEDDLPQPAGARPPRPQRPVQPRQNPRLQARQRLRQLQRLTERPPQQDGFMSMVSDILRDMTNDQRLAAQGEIVRVLHEARYANDHDPDTARNDQPSGSTSRFGESSRMVQPRFSTAAAGIRHDRFGIAISPERDVRTEAPYRSATEERQDRERSGTSGGVERPTEGTSSGERAPELRPELRLTEETATTEVRSTEELPSEESSLEETLPEESTSGERQQEERLQEGADRSGRASGEGSRQEGERSGGGDYVRERSDIEDFDNESSSDSDWGLLPENSVSP